MIDCLLKIAVGISLLLSIAAITLVLCRTNIDNFRTGECPKNKCLVKNNSGSYHYFCSDNCVDKEENVKGKKIKEPMAWQVRFV